MVCLFNTFHNFVDETIIFKVKLKRYLQSKYILILISLSYIKQFVGLLVLIMFFWPKSMVIQLE